jgi:predicted unusual protein kinase regulating ubiquinone biosynthesis (AarF/ABC1/UbiB family)
MSNDSKPLNSIKSRGLSRGLSLLKASIKVGSVAAKQFMNSNMTPQERTAYLVTQVKAFTEEMGQLKGSAMKVGQLISTYGEHFLPPEANKVLKSLQQKSPPVSWSVIERQVQKELGQLADKLEIEKTPLASASIGQVHRAKNIETGEIYAVKVQYPGVDQAIDSDLKIFKLMLATLNLLPRGARMDQVFEEVREMLYQEVDYRQELAFTSKYYEELKDGPRFVVPKPEPQFCTPRIMVTHFIEGSEVDSTEVLSLSQERRNRLGKNYLELYLDELTKYKLVQTDPHFGNYRVQVDPKGENDRLVLFDFGAMRVVPDRFLKNYKNLMRAGLERNEPLIVESGKNLNLLENDDSHELKQKYVDLCLLITEPFADPQWGSVPDDLMTEDGVYDWGKSDLPKRVATMGSQLAFNFKLRSPPKESVFLDRKLGGVFIFLKVLGCKLEARSLLRSKL